MTTAALLATACSVTWRQPEIRPLNPVRQFAVPAAALCDALLGALGELDLEAEAVTIEADACLVETGYRRLTGGDDPLEQLREVAHTAGGDFFSHGRFLVTASVRELDEGSRIRLTTRIEGFDAGYRVLRSTGLIEEELFERIAAKLKGPAPEGAGP